MTSIPITVLRSRSRLFFAWSRSRPKEVGAGTGSGTLATWSRSRPKKWRLRNTAYNSLHLKLAKYRYRPWTLGNDDVLRVGEDVERVSWDDQDTAAYNRQHQSALEQSVSLYTVPTHFGALLVGSKFCELQAVRFFCSYIDNFFRRYV